MQRKYMHAAAIVCRQVCLLFAACLFFLASSTGALLQFLRQYRVVVFTHIDLRSCCPFPFSSAYIQWHATWILPRSFYASQTPSRWTRTTHDASKSIGIRRRRKKKKKVPRQWQDRMKHHVLRVATATSGPAVAKLCDSKCMINFKNKQF